MKKLLLLLLIVVCGIANAQNTILTDFSGASTFTGSFPGNDQNLISDGTFLYGITQQGGINKRGVIFKIMPNGTGYVKLHVFTGYPDGRFPTGSLISDGTFLYGMTSAGGTNDLGTLFKIMPNGTGYVKLLDFAGTTNGSQPLGSLIYDGTFLYGMTYDGGTNNMGTLFKIMPNGTGYVTLLNFANVANGKYPKGSLISDGTFLYGMTSEGGTNNLGTIFKIMPNGTGYVKMLDFAGYPNGSHPYGSLISDGTFLYGMTNEGGTLNGGTIFKIMPNGTGYSTLVDFVGINGGTPYGSLIFDGTFLYGMTYYSNTPTFFGCLFKVMPNGTGFVKLHEFAGSLDGSYPRGSVISDGTFLYGMTTTGGTNELGTIFKIMSNGTGYQKLLDFAGATYGSYPYGSLISDGTFLYGMTSEGGSYDLGTIFKILPNGTGYAKIHDFVDGTKPFGSLISDGTFLYGMTSEGGTSISGTLFKIMPNGTGYLKMHDFTGTPDGQYPFGSLISDGTYLYGMTWEGGTNNMGTLFKIMPNGTGYMKLLDFAGVTNGSKPTGSLIYDGTFLYGMTSEGGTSNIGTLFKIMPDGTGFVKLLDFTGTNGGTPNGDLISDGTFLYGMTSYGGSSNEGNLFKILPNGTGYVNLLDFAGTAKGSSPYGSLISDGTFFYGMTSSGGSLSGGTLFKILPNGTGYVKLLDFTGTNGGNPSGSLISDGTFLYGMTFGGGSSNVGTVFKYGITTGLSENIIETGFAIYPNPSNGIFQLEVVNTQLANGEIEIYNVMGEKILSQKIQNEKSEIDLSNQSNGIYFLQLKTDPSKNASVIATKKIFINK